MSANTTRALVVAFVVVVGLFVLFGGGAMTGGRFGGGAMTGGGMGGGMMGNAWMGGFGWMWIPTLVALGFGALVVWGLFGKKP